MSSAWLLQLRSVDTACSCSYWSACTSRAQRAVRVYGQAQHLLLGRLHVSAFLRRCTPMG